MGKLESLSDQVPIEGLGIWQPLSLDYVKAKGSAQFLAYTHIAKGIRPHASGHQVLHGSRLGGSSLIDTFKDLPGTRAFGPTRIRILDWQGLPLSSASKPPPDMSHVRCTVLVDPWGAFKRSYRPFAELWLQHIGAISRATRIKLTNPAGAKRPLVRPYMAHYSDVVIPATIERALKERFKGLAVTVRVLRPHDTGPF